MAALDFDRKKTVMAVVGAGVLGLAGWLAWDLFMAEPPPPPPPPPKPVAKSAAKPVPADKLIEELIVLSGLRKALDQIPQQVAMGAKQSSGRARDPAAAAEVEKIIVDSFLPERFQKTMQEAFSKNFERKRVEALLVTFRGPLAKKMVALEGSEVKGEDLAAYARGLAAKPLPKERLDLVQQLDTATKSSEFATEIVMATTMSMVRGAVAGDAKALADFDRQMEAQRSKMSEAIRGAVQLTFAYIYRDVGDAELADYVKVYDSEDGRWLMALASKALIEEFRNAGTQAGERIAVMIKSRKPAAAAAGKTPAIGKPAAAVATEPGQPAAASRPLTARSKLDARECLKLETNLAIHRCAEGFR